MDKAGCSVDVEKDAILAAHWGVCSHFLAATIIITYGGGRIDRLLSETIQYDCGLKATLKWLDIRENF